MGTGLETASCGTPGFKPQGVREEWSTPRLQYRPGSVAASEKGKDHLAFAVDVQQSGKYESPAWATKSSGADNLASAADASKDALELPLTARARSRLPTVCWLMNQARRSIATKANSASDRLCERGDEFSALRT